MRELMPIFELLRKKEELPYAFPIQVGFNVGTNTVHTHPATACSLVMTLYLFRCFFACE